jgi:GT2 family glycosyltransferase
MLSILIVNYNGLRFLRDCLDSVQQHVHCPHEVIIVDNASSDDSVAFIRENYPAVNLIASQVNTGFTGGNNLAARAAKGDLLLLLNNDTVILSDIQPAVDRFASERVGSVGVHLCYGDGRNQPSAGYAHTPARLFLSWLGLGGVNFLPTLFRRVETKLEFYQQDQADLAWVSGAFLLTPRALWESLGGLDERYFMYVEDVDYCHRVRQAGYEVAYMAGVDVMHYEGAGREWIGEMALMRTVTSYSLFLNKYYGKGVARLTKLGLGLVFLLRALAYRARARGRGMLAEKWHAYSKAGRYLLSAP